MHPQCGPWALASKGGSAQWRAMGAAGLVTHGPDESFMCVCPDPRHFLPPSLPPPWSMLPPSLPPWGPSAHSAPINRLFSSRPPEGASELLSQVRPSSAHRPPGLPLPRPPARLWSCTTYPVPSLLPAHPHSLRSCPLGLLAGTQRDGVHAVLCLGSSSPGIRPGPALINSGWALRWHLMEQALPAVLLQPHPPNTPHAPLLPFLLGPRPHPSPGLPYLFLAILPRGQASGTLVPRCIPSPRRSARLTGRNGQTQKWLAEPRAHISPHLEDAQVTMLGPQAKSGQVTQPPRHCTLPGLAA